MSKKIFLWSAPRSVSTAFERSITEVNNTKVFHEPYCRSYYYGPERQSTRYIETPEDIAASYKEVSKLLTKEYNGIDHIFSKDMAYVVANHFDELLKEDLKSFQHTFLIRSPMKTVISLYKASINKQLTGWDYFDPVEAGFKQIWELFQFIKKNFNEEPVVVDADDLMGNPKGTMQAYCNATGLPFDVKIMKWKPGPIYHTHDWDLRYVCNGWHENVLKSSGFEKQDPERLRICEEDIKTYPKEVQLCIKESLPYYNLLKGYKLNPIVEKAQV